MLVHNIPGDRLNARAVWRKGDDFPTLAKEIAKVLIISFILPLILSACAIKGDFDRLRPTIIGRTADKVLPKVTKLFKRRGGAGVTDDEIAMREAGHRLSGPLNTARNGASGPNGNSGYGSYGIRPVSYRNSHPLSAIEIELEIDHQALTQFGNASRRVLITVSKRMQAVDENAPNLRVKDKRFARKRMRKNLDFIESTFKDFDGRLRGFHSLINEVRTNSPDVFTIELEGSLDRLRDRAASLKYELTQFFATASAQGEYQPPRYAWNVQPRTGPRMPYRLHTQP